MEITFHIKALEQYNYWAMHDKKVFKKLDKLIADILRQPYEGIGKPERLKHELSEFWSRRITEKDRLVYKVTENQVSIIQCKGHY